MQVLLASFTEELIKTADLKGMIEHAIGGPGSPLRKAMGRAALLGAGTATAQAALGPHAPGEERHFIRNALAGAAAGAMAGRAFPGWFGRGQMKATE